MVAFDPSKVVVWVQVPYLAPKETIMSRSYKKTPYCGDNKGKFKKRTAMNKVRTKLKDLDYELPKGGAYKKIYETWNICDYSWITSWREYWQMCIRHWHRYGGEYPDKKEEYRYWLKWYRNK